MVSIQKEDMTEGAMDVDNFPAVEATATCTDEHAHSLPHENDMQDISVRQGTPQEGMSSQTADISAPLILIEVNIAVGKQANEAVADQSEEHVEIGQLEDDGEHANQSHSLPEDDEGELEAPGTPASVASTEIEPEKVVRFESTPAPGIKARDYAFHPVPMRLPLLVFPILTTYIWFHYNRWRVIKQKPRILLDGFTTAFLEFDLVHLVHFNWITIKEISWLDARNTLGRGLIHLYEHPQDVQISYGAKRPSPKAPMVTKWFSRFATSSFMIERTLSAESPRKTQKSEKLELNFYGPFGSAIHRYFPPEETVVFWPLYEYLIGKGPRPMMSELMEHVFEPVLNCRGGGIGGRGKPYERPRSKDDVEPREGTEPEYIDVSPDLLTIECSKVPAFVILRKEHNKKREKELREHRKAEAASQERQRKKRGHNWSPKKTHKPPAKKAEKVEIVVEEGPIKHITRSMARAANEEQINPSIRAPRRSKGKGRVKTAAKSAVAVTGDKRLRDEEEDADVESVDQPRSDPGPSKGPTARRTRRKIEHASADEQSVPEPHDNIPCMDKGKSKEVFLPSFEEGASGTKRRRDEEEDSEIEYVDQAPLDPGPSQIPTHRSHRNIDDAPEMEVRAELHIGQSAASEARVNHDAAMQEPRGTKQKAGLASEAPQGVESPFKRRRLDEAGSSDRLLIWPPSAVEEAGTAPNSPVEEPVALLPQFSAGEAGRSETTVMGTSPSETVVANPTQPAQVLMQPEPAPPQLPPAPHPPRPLRRTETFLSFDRIIHPNR